MFGNFRDHLAGAVASAAAQYECESAYLIADEFAAPLARTAERIVAGCRLHNLGISLIDGHEGGKSEESVARLWSEMHRLGVMRRSLVIGIGGGVTCDVVGFTAGTYMRGLPYLLAPTTLMAQVDAAIGGKTGFNFAGQKNLVGCFHHPVGVVVDSHLLQSLPDRIFCAGLAEVIKVGVVGSPALFHMVTESELATLRHDRTAIAAVVRTAIEVKLRLLQDDPLEVANLRRSLNFGHCVGHAVEAEYGYNWLHGECVAVGMAVACRVGSAVGVTDPGFADHIVSILNRLGLPDHVPDRLSDAVWAHMDKIARVRNGRLNIVVPATAGVPEILPDWPADVSWDGVR